MNAFWNKPALRLGALLAALGAWHAPEAAAQSQIVYQTSLAGKVTHESQTTSYLLIEGFNSNGTQVATYKCITPNACNPRFGNDVVAATTTLQGFNGAREEIVSETCQNVVSTVPIGRCSGALRIHLRLRSGTLKTPLSTTDPQGRPFLNYTSGVDGKTARIRFEFLEDATKHWDFAFPGNVVTGERFVQNMPAGSYRVYADPLAGNCKPVHHNAGVTIDVPEGGTVSVPIVYRGTDCTVAVQSMAAAPANVATITSQPAGLVCDAGATPSTCRISVPFRSTLRLDGSTLSGWSIYFPFVNNNCHERNRDNPVFCDVDVSRDSTIKVWISASTAPPPPPPVALAAARGPAAAASASAAKGTGNVAMLQLRLTPANGSASLTSLTVSSRGDGRDDLDLTAVKLFVDANGNGQVDAGEAELASGRIAADNGDLKLVLATPLAVTGPVDLLVAADVSSEIHVAAASLGGAVLALFGLLVTLPGGGGGGGGGGGARRRRAPLAIVSIGIVLAALAACGGGSDEPAAQAVEEPAPPVAAAVVVSYQLIATGVEATTTGASPSPIAVDALPVEGAVISVTQ
ncbi:MAG TPA: hypothetical protein VHM00_01635 [Caldimonas sp.]|nr:hypothetical protein [Caldimonas sp.]HEX2539761.1 hypothetical protein [Caldimonas sp.]